MNNNYGILLQPNVELQRNYFKEMCTLLGVNVEYSFPLRKEYTLQGEIGSNDSYSEPQKLSVIFNEHVDQATTKKLGWNAEMQDKASLISVPYNLEGLQIGCRFLVPSAFDNTPPRLFRVHKLSAIQMYPASITCEAVPEYETEMEMAETEMFVNTNFNLLNEGD